MHKQNESSIILSVSPNLLQRAEEKHIWQIQGAGRRRGKGCSVVQAEVVPLMQ